VVVVVFSMFLLGNVGIATPTRRVSVHSRALGGPMIEREGYVPPSSPAIIASASHHQRSWWASRGITAVVYGGGRANVSIADVS